MKSLFLLSLIIFMPNTWGKPCGLTGTITERIKECEVSKGHFHLVIRDEKGLEIYKDTKSGLVWGSRITYEFNQYGSQKACDENLPESKLLKDLNWRLPTVKEFEQASADGMKASLPHMNHWFWTSTPAGKMKKSRSRKIAEPPGVFIWNSVDETTEVGTIKDGASVRCVAKD